MTAFTANFPKYDSERISLKIVQYLATLCQKKTIPVIYFSDSRRSSQLRKYFPKKIPDNIDCYSTKDEKINNFKYEYS